LNFLLLVIFFVTITINPTDSKRYTDEYADNAEKGTYGVTQEQLLSAFSQQQQLNSPAATIPSTDTGVSRIERQYYQQGDPARIKKNIYHENNISRPTDINYLPGDRLIVFVEIVPVFQNIKKLWIHELVDERLSISNRSNIYRFNTAEDIYKCLNSVLKNQSLKGKFDSKPPVNYGIDNLITYGNIRLEKPSRLVYWYIVDPNYALTYYTETQLRFYETIFPDMDYPTKITVETPLPKFDVGETYNNRKIIQGDNLSLTYDIAYLGGVDNKTKIKISFSNTSYCQYVPNRGDLNKTNEMELERCLESNEVMLINKTLKFDESGSFPLPCITIEIEKFNYKDIIHFDDEDIIVESLAQRNKDYTYIILSLSFIAVILSQLFNSFSYPSSRLMRGLLKSLPRIRGRRVLAADLILLLIGGCILSIILLLLYYIWPQLSYYIQ
jgi:hypothetical protein